MATKVVRTKQELESAVKTRTAEIVIEGELAEKIKNGKKINTVGKVSLAVLTAGIVGIPVTGGLSALTLAPIAALTGLEIALIAAVIFIGISLLRAVWKGYEEVDFDFGPPPRIRLRRKKR